MPQAPLFERIALIGFGLIGSSLARVARREGLARYIVACARTEGSLAKARALGLADSYTTAPEAAVEGADLVVLATPLGVYAAIAERIAPRLAQGAIVTDVGSVKRSAIRDVAPHMPEGVHFVPGHPIAGTEHSGPESGFAELFEGRWCILTPPPGTDEGAVERVAGLWRRAGKHDRADGRRAPRPGAGDHLAPAAPHRPTPSSAPPPTSRTTCSRR